MADMKRAGFIFDFDDTLVYSYEVFLDVQHQFTQLMQAWGLYDEELMPTLEARDIANVCAAGFMAADCFPQALVQTYESYCEKYGRLEREVEKESLFRLGWQVFEQCPREMEGARELLAELRVCYSGYPLVLFTQGEDHIQQQRVDGSGLGGYFDAVKIVRRKDISALRDLLAEQRLAPALSWYVGNSLRADINPAIEAGLNAVHFDITSWSYEHDTPTGHYHTIGRLAQFMELLREKAEVAQ